MHSVVQQPQMCTQDQGLLGGYDGLPVGADPATSVNMVQAYPQWSGGVYEVSRNMYQESVWGIPDDFQGGLFDFNGLSQTNPIWAGGVAPFGFLRVPLGEIGIHRIGLVISREPGASFSNISVLKLPLYDAENGQSLASTTSLDVQVRSSPAVLGEKWLTRANRTGSRTCATWRPRPRRGP